MNKMVINHLEKLFVTNDAATILRELEVQHPAAKMIVMASHMQEQEVGDGTNFVLVFAGALLELAEELLRIGLSVIEGYEIACRKAHEILPSLVCCSAKNLRDVDEVASLLHTSIMSKQYGNEAFLAKLIAQACVSIFPESGHFNVDNIRVCKILVQHPAAKMIVMASHMQEQEVGDGTNFVLVFAGALLELAEELLRIGLSVSEASVHFSVIEGYEIACRKAHEILPSLVCCSAKNLRDVDEVASLLHTSITSKQYGNEAFLAKLIAQACVSIFPESGHFNVDNIRVCKILGSGVCSSSVLHGMVFKKEVEGDVTSVKDAKIAVYSCPFDGMITETKGTVLIKTAEELMNFSKGEENLMDAQVKAIADTGANVIVTGGKVADMALHYANKYNVMLVRLNSKWDLRRLCKTVGATALPRLTPPVAEEMGHCDSVSLSEVGDTQVVVFKHEKEDGAISTIVLRGSTDNLMDDVERAVDDAVNTFKVLTRDKRLVPGGGATEIELAKQITSYGETCPGLEQYAIKKFAEAFEAVPRALSENSGVKANEVISKLYAVHQEGNKNVGLDIEAEVPAVKDMLEAGVLDTYLGKYWAIKLATNAAVTVLRVDQIIMAKPAGGPKPPTGKKDWDDDQND
ncbi:T-complex protein 1 subunit theta [Myotis davidii]|uniref:T-complex protein 1 subunit theta n=1 Tax=Myotis davidii TaxID=225400 RepID=L5MHF5_MYODS|nr:T-complex protein 1 subunit theta [Myotis davidii]